MKSTAFRSRARVWILTCLLAAGALIVNGRPCQAVILGPNSAIIAPGEPKPGAGVPVAGPLSVIITAPTYTGRLTSTVFANDPTNSLGGLTFTYLLENFQGSAHDIHRLTVSSFANFQTDVSYSTLNPGLPPSFATRNAVGDVIGYNFEVSIGPLPGNGALTPGTISTLLVIQTNAPNFDFTKASVINGSVTMVNSYAPLQIVPEPSTLALAGLASVCGAIALWRRRHAKV